MQDGRLWAAARAGGVVVFDLTESGLLGAARQVPVPGDAADLALGTGVLYVADRLGGLHVLDVADPDQPLLLSSLAFPDPAYAVACRQTTVYLTFNGYGCAVVDAADPRLVNVAGLPDDASSVLPLDAGILVGDMSGGLRILGPGRPDPMPRLSLTAVDETAICLAAAPGLLAVGCEPTHLKIVGLADPTAPVVLGSVDLPANPAEMCILGDHVFISLMGGTGNGCVVDISDPAAPVLVPVEGFLSWDGPMPWQGRIVSFNDNGCLTVTDVSDPSVPVVLGSTPTFAFPAPYFAAVSGDLTVVGGWAGEMVLIDLSDPQALQIVSQVQAFGIEALTMAPDVVYAAVHLWEESGSGLQVIDVSDPAAPVQGAFIPVPGLITERMAVVENVLYVAEVYGGVLAFDLTDPQVPVYAGTWGAEGLVLDVCGVQTPAGTVLATASTWAGMEILAPQWVPDAVSGGIQVPEPSASSAYMRLGAYPNPFNPTCALAFDLPREADVTLNIYDVLGRHVDTLAARVSYPAGSHRILWHGVDRNGTAVGSGAYFARLEAGPLQAVQKLILVR